MTQKTLFPTKNESVFQMDLKHKHLFETYIDECPTFYPYFHFSFPAYFSEYNFGKYKTYGFKNDSGKIEWYAQKYEKNPRIYVLMPPSDALGNHLLEKKPFSIKLLHGSLKPPFTSLSKTDTSNYFASTEELLSLEGSCFKELRHTCRRFDKQYPHVVLEPLSRNKEELSNFLKQWKARHEPKMFVSMSRDFKLLDFLEDIVGCMVRDTKTNQIIGLKIGSPVASQTQWHDICISIINKIDKDYKGLGEYLNVKACQYYLDAGFKWMNYGYATAPSYRLFKEKFLGRQGFKLSCHEYLLYKGGETS